MSLNKTRLTGKINKFDHYTTPYSAWDEILPYIQNRGTIWEPFWNDGRSGLYLKSLGLDIIHENEDFFENNKGDIIVTNPPFSIKQKVFERLKEIDKSFVVIVPTDTINRQYIKSIFKRKDLQIIIPSKRIQFIRDNKQTNNCNFECVYLCYKMNLEKDLIIL